MLVMLHPLTSRAATLIVTKTEDTDDGVCDADCSLREAVADAIPGDTITFDAGLSGATLTLTSELSLDKVLTLDGSSLSEHVKLSGGNAVRVISVIAGADVSLIHLDIVDGYVTGSGTFNGGGIHNSGVLTLTACALSGNQASDYGGGIYSNGTLNVISSTLENNRARFAGGIFNSASGTARVSNSTFNGNRAVEWSGGGIQNNGGVFSITTSTFYGNQASSVGGGVYNTGGGVLSLVASTVTSNTAQTGGGIYSIATLTLANSLVANNSGTTGPDCNGTLTSQDYNLIEDTTDCTLNGSTGHNVTGQDPLLGPLQDNGGGTATQALLSGSPALEQIPNSINGCGDTYTRDQRGSERPSPSGGTCDIGAYERRVHLSPTKTVAPDHDVSFHGLVTYTLTLYNAGDGTESQIVLSDTLPAGVNFDAWVTSPSGTVLDNRVISWQGVLPAKETITITFTANHVGDYRETVTNTMWVSSTAGESSVEAAFTVEDNLPPVADAGTNHSVTTLDKVWLDGSASYDPEGDPLVYAWTQNGGTPVSFTTTTSRTLFTAPSQSDVLTFTLTVSDALGLSDSDTVVIDVAANTQRIYLPLVKRG